MGALQAAQCFVSGNRDGYCLPESTHSAKVMALGGLLKILDIIGDTLREDSDRFLKIPGLMGIRAEMHSWSDCIAHRRYTLYLFADTHSPSYFKLYTAETTFSGFPNNRNCCLRSSCAAHRFHCHGCS